MLAQNRRWQAKREKDEVRQNDGQTEAYHRTKQKALEEIGGIRSAVGQNKAN